MAGCGTPLAPAKEGDVEAECRCRFGKRLLTEAGALEALVDGFGRLGGVVQVAEHQVRAAELDFTGALEGFVGLDLSASAAQSVVLMLLVIILTVVQFRYVESKVRYQ